MEKEIKQLRKHIKPLENEYNLIQEKMDKIGEFKFKVRGWLITIMSAIFIGLVSNQIPIVFAPFVFCLLFIFHFQEREQLELQNSLGSRVLLIEMALGVLSGIKDLSDERQLKHARGVLNRIESYPRIGIEMRKGATIPFKVFLQKMFDFNTNKVYYFLYSFSLIFCILAFCSTKSEQDKNKAITNENIQVIINQKLDTVNHD